MVFSKKLSSSNKLSSVKVILTPIRLNFGKKQKYVKFLGVLLDEHFIWEYHITELSTKLARVSGVFFKIRYFLPIDVLKSLYYAMFFFPFLWYVITVWGLTYPTYLQPLFILQKRMIKAMTYSSVLDHSDPLFRDLELLRLSDIHSLQLLSFVYNCVNHITPDYFSDYFRHVSDVHSISTRQAIRDD